MKRSSRRGLSVGTIFMLTLTSLVLIGFFALLPTLTGTTNISTNAIDLAVKLDQSFSQLISQAGTKTPAPTGSSSLMPLTTPPPTTTPVPTAPPVKHFSLCAAGAIQLDSSALNSLTDKETGYRFDFLFGSLGTAMQADLTIATLKNLVIPTDKLSSANMPVELLNGMKNAGIDAVCLGHPNALNEGISGLADTKNSITQTGMMPYGLYTTPTEQANAAMGSANGVWVALLSYQNELSSTGKKQTTDEERQYAYSPVEIETIQQDIARMRQKGAEVVIVSLCWGKTSATSPTQQQREQAQQIADAGADIILGTNPQAVFPVEILTAQRNDGKYHPVLCAYSMGNLFTYDRENRANLAGILLHADIQYDPATGTIAFDNLSYDPTYCWRGKINGATCTAILSGHQENAPDFVEQNQLDVMGRCYKLITQVMQDSVLKER